MEGRFVGELSSGQPAEQPEPLERWHAAHEEVAIALVRKFFTLVLRRINANRVVGFRSIVAGTGFDIDRAPIRQHDVATVACVSDTFAAEIQMRDSLAEHSDVVAGAARQRAI